MRVSKVEDRRSSQSRHGPVDADIQLKFGGGLFTRASEEELDEREAKDGQNFDLDLLNRQFRNRKPFDLIGQVPNGAEIRGGACLLKSDGTVSVLVQAGTNVYEWDGATTFTLRGTVSSSAKLRGRLEHNWQLTDKVLITDLNLQQPVMEWDGTTLQNVTFTDENAAGFGTFRAKYCLVSNERAIFANVYDNGTLFPHLAVGSERSDYTVITTSNRPSSALSEADPFFLVQPDIRPINGLAEAFGVVAISSEKGSMFKLTGESAKDFAMAPLYPRSGASGDEAVAYVGNDIVFGREGRIETLFSTDRFGDVETDDLSVKISDQIADFNDWLVVYNQRLQRVYFHPVGESQIWVLHKPLVETQLSPWSKWVTAHSMSFNPTFMMNMLDPADGLEYVFMGDANGNFYRLEGTGTSGDGGQASITTTRLSKLFSAPLDAEVFNIQGYIKYRKNEAATVTIRFEFAGQSVFNEDVTITIPALSRKVYGGGYYYNASNYYGTAFAQRLTRQKFAIAGKASEFQVRVTVTGTADIELNEIGIKLEAAS
jgi:hypothetical protein